jgi:RNA polymerase sigma-70 factor (ECF subfamily)
MSHPPAVPSEQKTSLTDACSTLARERRTRSADADDVSQEACMRALEVSRPQAVRDPVRYLLKIARNLIVDRARKRVRDAALIETLAIVECDTRVSTDPERVFAGKQELRRVLAAIGKLPPRCREAFILHRFHGLSYAAIARRMGVSTSMIEKHIAEAMLRITRASRALDEAQS